MMNIKIQDSFQQIKIALEDLQAISVAIAMVKDHPFCFNVHETFLLYG